MQIPKLSKFKCLLLLVITGLGYFLLTHNSVIWRTLNGEQSNIHFTLKYPLYWHTKSLVDRVGYQVYDPFSNYMAYSKYYLGGSIGYKHFLIIQPFWIHGRSIPLSKYLKGINNTDVLESFLDGMRVVSYHYGSEKNITYVDITDGENMLSIRGSFRDLKDGSQESDIISSILFQR